MISMRYKKGLKKVGYENAKKEVKSAKDEEEKYKKTIGKVQLNVAPKIESILSKYHIEKSYYHGGKYNGKAMVRLMDYKHSSIVIMKLGLLSSPSHSFIDAQIK